MTTNIKTADIRRDEAGTFMKKILASPVFSTSPRQQQLLRYLFEQSFSGHPGRLKGYVIGVELFGRGPDFDPGNDAIVRVEVGRLRAKLREYYQGEGHKDHARLELPKGSYTLLLNPARPDNSEKTIMRAATDMRPTLAVLPLLNLSAETGQDYFVDGMTDSLIFGLSRLSGLLVISRQSTFTYRNSTKSSEAIADELGVRYLLQGSVQRQKNRVRITAHLADTKNGSLQWSERFDREVGDIFALQDEITRNVVRQLQVQLAPTEAALFGHDGTNSIEAHDAFLRGLECHWKYTPRNIAEARRYFVESIGFDPKYAAAHAWLARSILHQWIMRWDDAEDARERALHHAELAVNLAPELPYALSILGWVHLWQKAREPAISCCRRAVALDPNNHELLNFLSMTLSSAGLGSEALFYSENARRLNPHSSPFYEFVLGQAYFVLEDYEKATEAFERGCAMSSTFAPNHVYLGLSYLMLDQEKKMQEKTEYVLSLCGGNYLGIETPWLDKQLAATFEHLLKLAGMK